MNSHERKTALKMFARIQLRYDRNRVCALVNIVRRSAELVGDQRLPAEAMLDDIEKIIIGTDMTNGRGRGGYFVGNFLGSEGFRKELRDDYNQVQHAVAGIVIGFRYGVLGYRGARWVEEEPQDERLYDATCPLGMSLNDGNYSELADRLRRAIADNPGSCTGPILGPGDFPATSSSSGSRAV